MSEPIKFEPHIRMFWSNRVDVHLTRTGGENNPGKIGSFTTYGKIMSFIMRYFFGVEFEQIELAGKIHFVRPKEWEALKRIASSQGDDVPKWLHDAIVRARGILLAPVLEEPTVQGIGLVAPLPQPPVQQKMNVLSLYPNRMAIELADLEKGVFGDEFQPIHDDEKQDVRAAVLFLPYTARPQAAELDGRLTQANLSNTPAAVIFCDLNKDLSFGARPNYSHAGMELPNPKHRVFQLLETNEGLNRCAWNERQLKEIRQFLRNSIRPLA